METWEPVFTEKWRHGGWYTNVRYPGGAVGCVAKCEDGWAIACPANQVWASLRFSTRSDAAKAEYAMVNGGGL